MAAADFAAMDDAALAGVISDLRDAICARNAALQDDGSPAAKNVVQHRRYALTDLDRAEGRLRLCAAHPLEPGAKRPPAPGADNRRGPYAPTAYPPNP